VKTYKLQNKLGYDLEVVLEPWGEEFVLPTMAILYVDIVCTKEGLLETCLEESVLTIWLWAGCRAEVYINGDKQVGPSLDIPVPG
jgi:hypothetical protein